MAVNDRMSYLSLTESTMVQCFRENFQLKHLIIQSADPDVASRLIGKIPLNDSIEEVEIRANVPYYKGVENRTFTSIKYYSPQFSQRRELLNIVDAIHNKRLRAVYLAIGTTKLGEISYLAAALRKNEIIRRVEMADCESIPQFESQSGFTLTVDEVGKKVFSRI